MRRAALALFLSIGLAAPAVAEPTTYRIDPDATRIAFSVRVAGLSEVRGQFRRVEGAVAHDPADAAATRVEVSAPVAGLTTGDDRRDRTLKSPDWFDAAAHPTVRFRSLSAVRGPDGRSTVTGELTMRGVTQVVRLDAVAREAAPVGGRPTLAFDGSAEVDRRRFGMTALRPLASDTVRIRVTGRAVAR